MTQNTEFVEFNDFNYDNMCKDDSKNDSYDEFGHIENRKYWTFIGMEPGNNPIENVNRARFMVNNYDGDPENIDYRFQNAIIKILDKAIEQLVELQRKLDE